MNINKCKKPQTNPYNKDLSSVTLYNQITNLTRCINDCNLEIQDLRKKNIDLSNKIADLSCRLAQIDIAQRKKDQTHSPSLIELLREMEKMRESERNHDEWPWYIVPTCRGRA